MADVVGSNRETEQDVSGSTAVSPELNSGRARGARLAVGFVCLLLVALAASAIALYRHLNARPDPRETVIQFISALRAGNGAAVKRLEEHGPHIAASEQIVQRLFQQYPTLKDLARDIVNKVSVDVGKSVVDGDSATVPVTMSIPGLRGSESADVNLSWTEGRWKISDKNRELAVAVQTIVMSQIGKSPVLKRVIEDLVSGRLKLPDSIQAQ
jgi:hypothetical protein